MCHDVWGSTRLHGERRKRKQECGTVRPPVGTLEGLEGSTTHFLGGFFLLRSLFLGSEMGM